MLYSKLFGKSQKIGKEFESANATLLIKAGFIDQVMAGVYSFLPLGIRVLTKIEQIIREEMDKIGQEVLLPAIVPTKLWDDTGRLNTVDVLFKVIGANEASRKRNDAEYVLNCTHEDVVTPLTKKFVLSYKDLPLALYQIQTKFRNEPRAKSGLLRGREFRMKDLYSFHTSETDLMQYYNEEAMPAYIKVYERLGLGKDTVVTLASGGDFTENYSHEFQTICEAGEDTLFHQKSTNIYYNREVAPSKAPNKQADEPEKPLAEVLTEGITGVDQLVKFLNVPVEKTIKTMLYLNENEEVMAVAVRGDYEINEIKLKKVTGSRSLKLCSAEKVKEVTGAEVGYAGLLNLPSTIRIVMDDSLEHLKNFEMGANKTNYHTINVNLGRDLPKPDTFYDVKIAKHGDLHPETNEEYEVVKAAEVGNIFPLGTKYSKALDFQFKDENGDQQLVYMGSYGIGSSRVMGVLVEKFHDEKGIIWPKAVAPFQVHLVGLDVSDDSIRNRAFDVYNQLQAKGVEVLFDDRTEVGPGAKFADADLIGIPVRLVVSKRSGDKIEFKLRSQKDSELLSLEEIVSKI